MTIFTMEVENQLIQLGEAASRCQWEIGYIVWDWTERLDDAMMQIYSDAAKLTGKSMRSIRRYATVTEFYGYQDCKKYEILPFEYFAQAMTYPGRWQELLEACLCEMDRTGGGLPGADWLRALAGDKIVTSYEAENGVLPNADLQSTIRQLNKYIQALTSAVNALPLEGDVVARFVAALDQLQAAIDDITIADIAHELGEAV